MLGLTDPLEPAIRALPIVDQRGALSAVAHPHPLLVAATESAVGLGHDHAPDRQRVQLGRGGDMRGHRPITRVAFTASPSFGCIEVEWVSLRVVLPTPPGALPLYRAIAIWLIWTSFAMGADSRRVGDDGAHGQKGGSLLVAGCCHGSAPAVRSFDQPAP